MDVEISFLQDASDSFDSWLPRAQRVIPDVVTSLERAAQSVKASLLSFSDKPVSGCIKKIVRITADLDRFRYEAQRLENLGSGGGDRPECGLDAATYAVGSGYGLTPFTAGDRTVRLVAMLTDANGKYNYFKTLDDPEHHLYCGRHDGYVTEKQVVDAMKKQNAFWLLMIPEHHDTQV